MSDTSSQKNQRQRLLSIKDAAEFLGVSTKTVERRIKARELKAHLLGRQWRIAPEHLDQYLAMRGNWHRVYVS